MRPVYLIITCLTLCASTVSAQDSLLQKSKEIPQKYYSAVQHKADALNKQLTARTEKALSHLSKYEEKMKKKMMKVDSSQAKMLFEDSQKKFSSLKDKLKAKTDKIPGKNLLSNTPGVDSLFNTLSFLKQGNDKIPQLNNSLKSVTALQDKLAILNEAKAFIQQRKQLLNAQLGKIPELAGNLKGINKEAYYYAQQVKELKETFSDKKKIEKKALEIAQKIPAYNEFMAKHSYLGNLLGNNLGGGGGTPNLEGLQTRAQVEQLIQQRLGSGPNASQAVSQSMAEARAKMNELKSKFPDLDNAGEMPNFKPNEMKSKRFLQRLEYGGNIQFARNTSFYPTTSDIAGQIAYKFHKNGVAGVGMAYKLGLGQGFNKIAISSEGLGLRSFVDWKLKNTFFLNGGYEQNYQPVHINAVPNAEMWTSSALLGIKKKYKVSAKMKGDVSLLFDFLYSSHVPRTDPIKLRMGYNF
ncbi:hypothetical protein SAMN05444266_101139 [Chitinophaga jiangningensis]|uniref:Uncharacterized protein n=1 Tax=Chitinophaga jiangningensis TaxID=1419482 RepID=A0A1M6VBB6_9BACT|nr:hypothetical protein [Chitinophaga jiangningensis]SHK78654.1 hypothetical protein SAMN05444266_101139 [Chitinophaga jiangningensis]